MNRRHFMAWAAAAGAASVAPPIAASAGRPGAGFKLKYAPHLGMFRHHAGADPIDQLKFMADQGFTAFEDNGMAGRPVELQEKMRKAMDELGLTMGVFVAHADFRNVTFARGGAAVRDDLVKQMKAAVSVAGRVGAKWCTVVPGRCDQRLEWDYQTAHVIENLRACAEVCEPAGLVMVLEPLNPFRDHPGLFLSKIPQAYLLCRAVDSPSCKILFDIYHQQITEGNLIPNMEKAWDEIAYFQVGDNPGRNEPGTGEINYRNVFRFIHEKGFAGVIGMEHGSSKGGKAGEVAVIEAYRRADDF